MPRVERNATPGKNFCLLKNDKFIGGNLGANLEILDVTYFAKYTVKIFFNLKKKLFTF